MTTITARPLTQAAFAPFGAVIALRPEPDMMINQGLCGRHHALALADITDGTAGISLFDAQPRSLPYRLDMVERHPKGSQAFLPLYETRFLVIVAPDANGRPGTPLAFLTEPGQGIQVARNTWHGVLTPLAPPGLFAVIDRIGEGPNLQEHWFDTPYTVTAD
ncbi:Ureidoglycolate hydrolase [Roseovarius sp. HI0049]|nr:Ureidoglycolate hydrolase [Roseovarius sp. HI0049]